MVPGTGQMVRFCDQPNRPASIGVLTMFDRIKIKALLNKAPRFRDAPLPEEATDDQINGLQDRTGIRVPDDLRAFLKIANGAWVDPGIFGIRESDPDLDIES